MEVSTLKFFEAYLGIYMRLFIGWTASARQMGSNGNQLLNCLSNRDRINCRIVVELTVKSSVDRLSIDR